MRRIRRALAAAILFAAAPALGQGSGQGNGQPRGDAVQGETIARRWCAACHVVALDQTRASADAPSFMAAAAKVTSPAALSAFLADPHPKMPDMSLTRDEIADLTAYIVAMKP